MRFEKDYVVSFRSERGGYPSTVLVNAYNKNEAKEKCREFIRRGYRNTAANPKQLRWDLIEKEVSNLIFHFGIAMNTILDIRD